MVEWYVLFLALAVLSAFFGGLLWIVWKAESAAISPPARRQAVYFGDGNSTEHVFERGDRVGKISGYEFYGVVIGKMEKLDGSVRYAVESVAPHAEKMIHIYSGAQLRVWSGPWPWESGDAE